MFHTQGTHTRNIRSQPILSAAKLMKDMFFGRTQFYQSNHVQCIIFYSGSSLHKFGNFMIRCWQEAGGQKACDANSLFQRTFFLGHEADTYIWTIGKVENWRAYFMTNYFCKVLIAFLWP